MKKQNKIALFLLVAGLAAGCATSDFMGDFNLISPERETALGRELSQGIAKEETLVTDPEIAGYVSQIGRRLVAVSQTANQPRHFHVIDKDQVNAFAIPGGHMYVMTGLIEAAKTEAELAAVMAHELAHDEERHPTERLSRQMGMQMLMNVLLGKNPGQTQQVVSSLLANSGISAYSRSAEFQADRIGTYLLNRAGYDPHAMVNFFQTLVALEQQQGGGGANRSLFATHPPTPDRIQAIKELVASFGNQRSRQKAIVGNFSTIQKKVKARRK